MDASAWRSKRLVDFKAPSGSVYKLRLPDPVTLIQAWVEAGVEKPLDQKDLGEKVTNPETVAKILMRFIVEPKITVAPSEQTIGINELMEDQMDTLAVYRKIISPFVEHADQTAEFFRSLGLGVESGIAKPSGPQAPNRGFETTVQGPNHTSIMGRSSSHESPTISRNSRTRDSGA